MCGCNKNRGQSANAPVAGNNSILGRLRNRATNGMTAPHVAQVSSEIDPSRWGPPLWKMLHILAFATSASGMDLSEEWNALFQALQKELPCPVCRSHVQEWFNTHTEFREIGIQQFILNLHNDVNARRRVPLWSIQQVETTYSAGGKEKQLSLLPLLLSSVSMMQMTTTTLQIILASVS